MYLSYFQYPQSEDDVSSSWQYIKKMCWQYLLFFIFNVIWFTTILSQIVDERLNDLQSSHSQPHPHVGSNQRHCSGEIISCQRCSLYWHSVFKRTSERNVENINHTYQQSWERRRACSRGAPRCRGGQCWCWWGCRVGGTCSAELSDWSWYISSELRSWVILDINTSFITSIHEELPIDAL